MILWVHHGGHLERRMPHEVLHNHLGEVEELLGVQTYR